MGVREWQRAEHWKSETGIEKRRTLNRECGDRKENRKTGEWEKSVKEKRGTLRTGEQSVWKKRVRENRECGDEMSESEPVRDNRRDASAGSNATFAQRRSLRGVRT